MSTSALPSPRYFNHFFFNLSVTLMTYFNSIRYNTFYSNAPYIHPHANFLSIDWSSLYQSTCSCNTQKSKCSFGPKLILFSGITSIEWPQLVHLVVLSSFQLSLSDNFHLPSDIFLFIGPTNFGGWSYKLTCQVVHLLFRLSVRGSM